MSLIRLKQLREEKGLLQKDIADYLEITPAAYGFYEQGRRHPDPSMLMKLADYFGVSIDYLLGRTEIRRNPTPQEIAFIMTQKPNVGKTTLLTQELCSGAKRITDENMSFTPPDMSPSPEDIQLLQDKIEKMLEGLTPEERKEKVQKMIMAIEIANELEKKN